MTFKEHLQDCLNLLAANPNLSDMKMFAVHGASGDVSEISYMHVTDRVTECGPFDLEPGEKYIDVYVGN